MIVAECVSCRYGDHSGHQDVPNPGTEGLIDSRWECPCRGECEGREPPHVLLRFFVPSRDSTTSADRPQQTAADV